MVARISGSPSGHSLSITRGPLVLTFMVAALLATTAYAASPAFDTQPWLQDLDTAREAVMTKYANLEWLVTEREVDLSQLFKDTESQIRNANSAAEARTALDRWARSFGDGHVKIRWPDQPAALPLSAQTCAAIGFDARMQGAPIAAHMPGYRALADAPAPEFPSGTVEVSGHKVGVLKIGIFTPQGIPSLCDAALHELNIAATADCDDACSDRIMTWASDRMTHDFDAQLQALAAAGADVLLIDVANNGGGTEWAEAAARMVTGLQLRSERIGFVRGTHWAENFAGEQKELLAAMPHAHGADRALLTQLTGELKDRISQARATCDSTPLWQGKPMTCHWLADGFFGSGLLASADPAALRSKAWAPTLFTPLSFPYRVGVWSGPLIVLVNAGTASAAEEFAAVLQDNRAAVIIGAPTYGAGCGHTNGGTPTKLKNSGAVLELPDCARLRADGSNEVMGIQADVLVGLRANDGPSRQAARVLAKLPDALVQALTLGKAADARSRAQGPP
jgi:Peptidase family S41